MVKKRKLKRGILISFEGSEGSGKTTQVSRISSRFEEEGFEVVVTREPGGTEISEEIRHLLMHASSSENMFPETELLLFAASRAQLVREFILPSLNEGKVILCDRFLDSTTVYQGVGRRIAAEPVHLINKFAVGDMMPECTVVVDLPAEVGLQRIKHRVTDLPDRMERENIEFYRKVREGFLMLAQALPERFVIADGDRDRDEVEADIWNELSRRFV
jgi:dTMP kinase